MTFTLHLLWYDRAWEQHPRQYRSEAEAVETGKRLKLLYPWVSDFVVDEEWDMNHHTIESRVPEGYRLLLQIGEPWSEPKVRNHVQAVYGYQDMLIERGRVLPSEGNRAVPDGWSVFVPCNGEYE